MKNTKEYLRIFEADIKLHNVMKWNNFNQPLGQCDLSGGYAPAKKRIWPAIIMAAAAIGSAVYSGEKSAAANREAQRKLDSEKALTEAEKRRKLNEDYIDTAAGQNLIRKAKTEADKIYKKEAGNAAMTGATERTAMAKEYGNNMVGEAIADIAANDTARKDKIDERYTGYERNLRQQQIALDQQKALNEAQVGSQIISGLGSAASAYAGTYMGNGSPGGAGVTPTKNALNAMGGDNATWMKNNQDKILNYNTNFDYLKTQIPRYTPESWGNYYG